MQQLMSKTLPDAEPVLQFYQGDIASAKTANGVSVELYPDSEKIKKQMNYANSKGVKYVVLIGENEIKKGVLSIKDMVSGEQSDIEIESLSNKILNG